MVEVTRTVATEQEFYEYFCEAAESSLGPASDDIYDMIMNEWENGPEGYEGIESEYEYFYLRAGDFFGPACDDIYYSIKEQFEEETGKLLPKSLRGDLAL